MPERVQHTLETQAQFALLSHFKELDYQCRTPFSDVFSFGNLERGNPDATVVMTVRG
jgi:hypothetical protein